MTLLAGVLDVHVEAERAAVEQHIAGKVFRQRIVAHHAQDETVNPGVVPREQRLHREPVAGRDLGNQRLIGGIDGLRRRPVGRNVAVRPSKIVAHWQPPV